MKRYLLAAGLAAIIAGCGHQQDANTRTQGQQTTLDSGYVEHTLADLDRNYFMDNGQTRRTADMVPVDYDGDGDVDHVGFNQDNQVLLYENTERMNRKSFSNARPQLETTKEYTIKKPSLLNSNNNRYVPSIDVFKEDGKPVIQFIDQANEAYHIK